MTDIGALLQQGAGNAWLFIPTAILLGALHGLEPGHSKTMMAAFIVAIRGTVRQALLLGLTATLSHTAVVWAVAMVGLYFGGKFDAETTEPYFQLVSAIIIIALAVWMIARTRREQLAATDHHHDESKQIDTGHGLALLSIFETNTPPRFRLAAETTGALAGFDVRDMALATVRSDGEQQTFRLRPCGEYYESDEVIPEPHAFTVRLRLTHDDHHHDAETSFSEEHQHEELDGLDIGSTEYQDAHARAHARDIQRRFTNRQVTNWQIALFGLTGGLIPCPAAITVLLLCLQLKQFSLGATLVVCFSIGLALTLVCSGVIAAIGMRHAGQRWPGFSRLAQRAPYASGGLIILLGLYIGYQAMLHLHWL